MTESTHIAQAIDSTRPTTKVETAGLNISDSGYATSQIAGVHGVSGYTGNASASVMRHLASAPPCRSPTRYIPKNKKNATADARPAVAKGSPGSTVKGTA